MPKLSRDIIDSDDYNSDSDTEKNNESNDSNKFDESVNSVEMDDDTYVEKNFKPEIFFADNQRQFRYFKMIDKYFKKCDQNLIDKMVKIINKDKTEGDCISLRVLEWVVTKCSRKNIDIKIDDKEYFSINIMYKAQLKSYKKTNFDPFRRDRKFLYNYDKNNDTKQVITTLGQLNFFKWAISYNIIECVERHYETIIDAMNKYNKLDKIKKKKKKLLKKKLKDQEIKSNLSSKSNKTSIIDIKSFTVDFD
jgi:hypothetical protein